jgi:predicted GNAT family N-acyltransferase
MSIIESDLNMAYPDSMKRKDIETRMAAWDSDSEFIQDVRTRVFVVEQHVPIDLERDGKDPQMIHVLAFAGFKAVGTARMSLEGHIGRVAVIHEYRGNNIGALMMDKLENQALTLQMDWVHLNAQTHAQGFYQRRGYVQEGGIFDEAGIPHIHMKKYIAKSL